VALELLVRQLGLTEAVDLPGHLENPYPFFAAASVYALSSRWEGLPTVLLEALALGLPIVATDCPSGPREILADGAYGRLVPPGDPAALAEALQRTLKDPRPPDPMLACAPYTLSTIVARYVSLLGLGPSGTTSAPP
jgi:glycosyltransferase involved in cell wall biosynthesis